jgi:hypothetical protein
MEYSIIKVICLRDGIQCDTVKSDMETILSSSSFLAILQFLPEAMSAPPKALGRRKYALSWKQC